MKVLVDHGSSRNLGDTAMLEGVVDRLLNGLPTAEAHITYQPELKTRLWGSAGVEPVTIRLLDRGLFGEMPFLWRYNRLARPLWLRYRAAALDRSIRAGSVRVDTGGAEETLDELCRRFDAYLVVGGGNLTDTFPGEVWRRCCLIHAFAAQGKPVILTGQQIGPWRSRLMAAALRRALRKADFLGLREPTDSLTFCRRAGIPPDRYAVMGDDSFGLQAADEVRVKALLDRYGLVPGGFLAVNVRIGSYAAGHGRHLDEIAALIRALEGRYGMPVVVVPIALNESDSDVASGHRLAERVGDGLVRVIDGSELTPCLAKGVLGRAHAAVGVSYHFCTFALSRGVPAICIYSGGYYSQKGRGLSRFWGDPRFSLALGQGEARRRLHDVFGVIEDLGLRERLRGRAEASVREWGETFDSRVCTHLARIGG